MKAVILAGGYGTRLSEETNLRPKPMVEIGGRPILWHILKMYSHYGINDFVICAGYKGYLIKEYFANYVLHLSDVTFDMEGGTMLVHQKRSEPWRVTVVDTGEGTMTGGRLKKVQRYLDDEDFCFTYGDGVADVDIRALIEFHQKSDRLATLTGVQPPERFGVLGIEGSQVVSFQEKPEGEGSWVSGGFFILDPSVIERISGDDCTWEREPLESLASDGQLGVYKHDGFWRPMDTLRDKVALEKMWELGDAPWKKW